MKRAFITTALALSLVFGYACGGNGKISKGESKRSKEYFTQTLQDADCTYSNSKKVKIKNIAKISTRTKILILKGLKSFKLNKLRLSW